jgi:uncharacterized Fe-S cluster protein YjdI
MIDRTRCAGGGVTEEDVHRQHPAVRREYQNDAIVVHWEPGLCIHAAECLRRLPSVFDRHGRPWINVDGAEPDAIATTVTACPSGALRFERRDGGPAEETPATAVVFPQPDGPYHVRGRIEIRGADGSLRSLTRATLCRCGASQNKPFCDLSHQMIQFKAP